MGRKKIQISRIQDERNRQITFSKRKAGLLKKAYELSVLCDVEVAVIMISNNSKLYQYASSNMNSILIRYTEFKDPDESKTNADILEDITRKEKGGHGDEDGGGEEDDDTRQYMVDGDHGGPTAYHRLNEEFEMLNHTATIQTTHVPAQPAPVLISPRVPQAMPVSIPVPSSTSPRVAQRVLGSAGSTGSSSTGTPFSPDTTSSPASTGSGSMMPPPTGTPTRLQTIRNQTLKLHLPGSGRHYISLGSGGSEKKSPVASDDSGGRTGDSSGDGAASSSRPQLRVVLPGQKGFVYRSAPSSPPPMVGLDNTVAVSSSATMPTVTRPNTSAASLNPVTSSMESLTTPVVSLSTPNILSNLSPLLSSLTSELPLGSATGGDSSASALVAFPVSIQPTPGTSRGQASGSNIVLQAQNMGQPFLLAPSNYENKQQLPGTFPFTPSSNPGMGLSPPLIRDLEQLKHQYDRIYQQISQTLHHHQLHQQHSQKDKSDEEDPPNPTTTAAGKEGDTATAGEPPDGEQESIAKRPRLDSAATTT